MKRLFCLLSLGLFFNFAANAATLSEKFTALSKDSTESVNTRIETLLLKYGNPKDFKITKELKQETECTYETQIRGRKICNFSRKTEKKTFFAESNGMLCQIGEGVNDIQCVSKTTATN